MKAKTESLHNHNIASLLKEFGHEQEERIKDLYINLRRVLEEGAKIPFFIPHRTYKLARETLETEYKHKQIHRDYTF